MKTLCITLAFGHIYDKAGTGKVKLRDGEYDGAIARFDALTRSLAPHADIAVYCTAGYTKQSPTEPVPGTCEASLSDQLARFVATRREAWLSRLFTKSLTWGVNGEIETCIKLAIRNGFAHPDEPAEVVVAVNDHPLLIWRTHIYLWLHAPAQWTRRVITTQHFFSPASKQSELPKFILALWLVAKAVFLGKQKS